MRGTKLMRGPKNEEAERALRHAIERTGHLVPGGEILRAWFDANGAGALPKEVVEGRWERLLRFSIESGEVFARRDGGVFWGVRGAERMTPLPSIPRPARVFGETLLARSTRAEAALARAVTEHRRMVSSTEICAFLDRDGDDCKELVPGRLRRVLEPAVHDDRVKVTSVRGTAYFGPADQPHLEPPRIEDTSDLHKIEEALRRAVASCDAAVTPSVVASIVDDAPELALRSKQLTVAHHLQVLVLEGRAKRVQSRRHGKQRRVYYSTPDGPTRLDPDLTLHMDRRHRAVHALWRSAGGRPFTTAAIRRFSATRHGYRIENDPPFGWTNALHHLERTGELVAVRGDGHRSVRWAVAAEWENLTPHERTTRMLDEFRVVEHGPDLGHDGFHKPRARRVLAASAPEHDVAFASRNQNLRNVVQLAKQLAADNVLTAEEAAIVSGRPVTLAQVRNAAGDCRHLTGGSGDVRLMLIEATRKRPGMRRPAVTKIGAVGGKTYFDVDPAPAAIAFVRFKQRMLEAKRARLPEAIDRLREAADLSADRVQPVPDAALGAWARLLWHDAQRHIARIEQSLESVILMPTERVEAIALVDALRIKLEDVRRIVGSEGLSSEAENDDATTPHLNDESLIDIAVAWSQIAEVAEYKLRNPRALQARIGRCVPTVRRVMPSTRAGGRAGRRVEVYFDRVAFAAYASMRWAGPGWATFAAHGSGILGPVRSPQAFVACLSAADQESAHAGAAAALGLLDDVASRAALAAYIIRALTTEKSGRASPPMAALASSAYGLAPKPFGGVVSAPTSGEREALMLLAEYRANDYAGYCGRRALAAWNETWDQSKLLAL